MVIKAMNEDQLVQSIMTKKNGLGKNVMLRRITVYSNDYIKFLYIFYIYRFFIYVCVCVCRKIMRDVCSLSCTGNFRIVEKISTKANKQR